MGAKKRRPPRHVLQYVVVKRWVTGDRAEMDEDQIRSELETEMRELMELSGQRKFPGHKTLDTYRGHWKLAGFMWTDAASNMKYIAVRCVIGVSARSVAVVTGLDFIELQRHGKDSHDNDGSKN